MSKYMNTKKGSLEESILGLWEKAADKKMEATGDKEKYQKFFQSALKKFGVKSPAELKGEKKKEFYDYVDKNYVGDHEESKSELDEKSAKYLQLDFKDKQTAINAYKYINHKLEPGGRQPWYDFNQEGNSLQFDKMDDADKLMKELKKKFKFKVYEREEVVKEASELGTKKDRDEKLNITPGQSPEDFEKQVNAMQEKNNSMRKTLAQIWGVDEGKSPFDKEEEKTPKKENKKTMTGKPETKVEVDPEIEENIAKRNKAYAVKKKRDHDYEMKFGRKKDTKTPSDIAANKAY